MTLAAPYLVYGIVTDGGIPVNGATIYIQNTTGGSTIMTGTTNSAGKYQMDISKLNIISNGNTVKVWCFKSGKYDDESFTLIAQSKVKNANFQIDTYNLSDSLTFTDTQSRLNNLVFSEHPLFTDVFIKTNDRIITDLMNILDSPGADCTGVYYRGLSDQMLINDARVNDWSHQIAGDSISLSDSFVNNIIISLSDVLAITLDYYNAYTNPDDNVFIFSKNETPFIIITRES